MSDVEPEPTQPESTNEFDIEKAMDNIHDTLDQFAATADVNAVYGEAIEHENHLIIPAAEVISFLGFGIGGGSGDSEGGKGVGIGGGGGGKAFARPVAVIVASERGVTVKPVVDFTKIYLTAFTALGFITAAWLRMHRGK